LLPGLQLHIFRVIKSKRKTLAGHAARMEDMRHEYKILLGKPEGNRPLERHRLRMEDNIKAHLK
jgi:hypothetical protein